VNSSDISSGHQTIIALCGYLMVALLFAGIIFAIFLKLKLVLFCIVGIICVLIFAYRYISKVSENLGESKKDE
jgi:uncharacterized ion transporter superfamily protein YfcC